MNQYERKVEKTKSIIKNTFIELLKEKSFFKITVSEICQLANINRCTFYAHFSGTDELIESIETELLDDLETLVSPLASYNIKEAKKTLPENNNNLVDVLDYISKHKLYFQALLSTNGDLRFEEKLKDIIKDKFYRAFSFYSQSFGENQEYVLMFLASGFVDTMNNWLKSNDKTTHELSDFYMKITYSMPFFEQH